MLGSVSKNSDKHVQKEKKLHLPLSAWLTYLLIASLTMSCISLARYTVSTGDSDGSARIGKFSVSVASDEDGNEIALSTVTLEEKNYTIHVENTSEVATTYKIIVNNIPNHIDVKIDDHYMTVTDGSVTYDGTKMLDIGDSQDHKFTFQAQDYRTQTSETVTTINVQFEQVD